MCCVCGSYLEKKTIFFFFSGHLQVLLRLAVRLTHLLLECPNISHRVQVSPRTSVAVPDRVVQTDIIRR